MNKLVIKGTVMGLSQDQVYNNFEFFVSTLHIVMENWAMNNFQPTGEFKNDLPIHVKRSFGEVRQALIAMDTDIHFLSVCLHQLKFFESEKNLERSYRGLYFTNQIESYFTTLRSIYDRMATFPRIVLTEDELKSDGVNKDSFNALVKSCHNSKVAQAAYDKHMIDMILNIDTDLQNVRIIRDGIIHHGKEPVVSFEVDRSVKFKIPSVIGNYSSPTLLPDILELGSDTFPLFDYLREITLRLLRNMEEMGNLLGFYWLQGSNKEWPLYYYGLMGYCMEPFMHFLFPGGIKTNLPPIPDGQTLQQ